MLLQYCSNIYTIHPTFMQYVHVYAVKDDFDN